MQGKKSKSSKTIKKIASIALVSAMLVGNFSFLNSLADTDTNVSVEASESMAEPKSLPVTINFDKSNGYQGVSAVTFDNMNAPLGMQGAPPDTGVWVFKRYFIGWSDNKKYATEKTGKFFFSDAKVSDVYPEGSDTSTPITLYAVYVGLDVMSSGIKASKIFLNKDVAADKTLLNTEIKESKGFDNNEGDKEVIGYYNPSKEKYDLDLSTNFQMEKITAMFTYFNPGGIITNSGTWSDGNKQGASYTHVDLHIKIDDRVDVADVLKDITFKSYNFKPQSLLDKDYNLLQGGLGDLTVQGDPTTPLTLDVKGKKEFILRTTIRRDGNPTKVLKGTPEEVMADMVLASGDKSNFTISKAVAKQLADSGDKLIMSGFIDGVSKASTVVYPIPKIDSKEIRVGFAIKPTPPTPPTPPGGGSGGSGGSTVRATAVLANGSKYTDVLTATVLANERHCPILLTETDNITKETLDELKRRGIGDVVISGGTDSVSQKVVDQLKDFKVVRYSGPDRYATAREIGKEVRRLAGKLDGAVLVDGTNFPDVITISALATQRRVPILITQPGKLNGTTENTIKDWSLKNVTIGGQKDSVSLNVESSVKSLVKDVDRIGGADRYITASLIGKEVRKLTGNLKDMILVDGTNFPDGITVNSLAAKFKCPIHLTKPNSLTAITADDIAGWKIESILVAGGDESVSKNVYDGLKVANKERISGSNRYSTAVKISQRLDNVKLIGR